MWAYTTLPMVKTSQYAKPDTAMATNTIQRTEGMTARMAKHAEYRKIADMRARKMFALFLTAQEDTIPPTKQKKSPIVATFTAAWSSMAYVLFMKIET